MNQIMLRHAEDDFAALLIAKGMAKAGAEVFCITNNGPGAYPRGLMVRPLLEDFARPQKFIVWARVRDDAHIDACDKAIEESLEPPRAQ